MITMGINGFGRIGRMVFRAAARRADIEIAAVNDLLGVDHLAYMLKYDSVHGRYPGEIRSEPGKLWVDGRAVRVTSEKDPARLAWEEAGVRSVVESTGIHLTAAAMEGHLKAGARQVILSAPANDDTPVYVRGVNDHRYRGEAIVSTATEEPAPDVSVVLAGDVLYDPDVCARMLPFLDRCLASGIDVLIGDPGRRDLPLARVRRIADYPVGDMGDAGRVGSVFSLLPADSAVPLETP